MYSQHQICLPISKIETFLEKNVLNLKSVIHFSLEFVPKTSFVPTDISQLHPRYIQAACFSLYKVVVRIV
jgi:hypothetical protein